MKCTHLDFEAAIFIYIYIYIYGSAHYKLLVDQNKQFLYNPLSLQSIYLHGLVFSNPFNLFLSLSLSLSLCFAKFILHKHTYIYIQRTVICMLFLNISIKADGGLCVDHSFWFMHIRVGSDIAPYKALFSVGV